jgi:tRNA pseudouridine55 synthase
MLADTVLRNDGEVLLVRKPSGWTSFDVVARLRTLLHVRKIGHDGALDPLATGLMIVCTGKRTREMEIFVRLDKEYVVTMRLGGRTPSYDSETPVLDERPIDGLCHEMVAEVLRQFVGPQVQLPPMWSAVKVGGKPLYKYARRGKVIARKPREIVIKAITLLSVNLPEVVFKVVCSKGTYVRALVNDIGEKLGCGAYVTALERIGIGAYSLNDALSLEEIVERQRSPQPS